MLRKSWFQSGMDGDKAPNRGFGNWVEWSWGKNEAAMERLKERDIEAWRKARNRTVALVSYFYTFIIAVVCTTAMTYWFGANIGFLSFLAVVGVCLWVSNEEQKNADKKWLKRLQAMKDEEQAQRILKKAESLMHAESIPKFKDLHNINNYAIMPDNDLVSSLHKKKRQGSSLTSDKSLKLAVGVLIILVAIIILTFVLAG